MEDFKRQDKIGIIPCTYFRNNNKPVGSSFLRVDRLVSNNPDFQRWKHGHKYGALIFQKLYWKEMMELFDGPKILDLCDPDWIKNGMDIQDTGKLVDAITCSSEKLTSLVQQYFPDKIVQYIPDRLDFGFYPSPVESHVGIAKTVVWFGFIHNAHEALHILAPAIKKNNLKLKIISHLPYSKQDDVLELNPEFHEFSHDTAYDLIKAADIVLNPKSNLAFFKYKSSNKSLIGWLLGLPVAHNEEELEELMDADNRNKQVSRMRTEVLQNYHIDQSAQQYRNIIKQIRQNKTGSLVNSPTACGY